MHRFIGVKFAYHEKPTAHNTAIAHTRQFNSTIITMTMAMTTITTTTTGNRQMAATIWCKCAGAPPQLRREQQAASNTYTWSGNQHVHELIAWPDDAIQTSKATSKMLMHVNRHQPLLGLDILVCDETFAREPFFQQFVEGLDHNLRLLTQRPLKQIAVLL